MAELIAISPLSGTVPVAHGGVALRKGDPGPITSVAPFRGQDRAVARLLRPLGMAFPEPNRMVAGTDGRIVWTGRGQAFLIGVAAPDALGGVAAVTDQSDGWAMLRLEGSSVETVLARLVPIDLRPSAFAVGHAARVPVNHMQGILMRPAPDVIDVMVYRSMARTAWHEIEAAMRRVAARG